MATRSERFEADLTPEAFRRVGYRAVDMLADYYETLDERPVYPAVDPRTVAAAFDEPLPESGLPPDVILDAWESRVLPYATHNTSPRFFGFVMGAGSMMGTIADLLAAGVNMNTGGWHPAPSGTEVERRCIDWLGEAIGFPAGGGLLTSGGTMANVTAVHTAFRAKAGYDSVSAGLQHPDRPGRYTLYMADHEGHSSIVRAMDLLNLGRDAVRRVPSDEGFRMDVDALEAMLDADIENGDIPFCVVGQVGSVNVSTIDPLEDIADVCAARDLWFHADGACGAVGAMVPEWRERYAGLARADSVTLDPHKWLSVPYECGAVLFRDMADAARAFTMEAGYLRGSLADSPEEFDYYEYGPQMSRGFRALKLWMTLKHFGTEGYRDLMRTNVACAGHLDALVRAHDDFEAVQEPNLFIYSFRYVPADLQGVTGAGAERVSAYLDELNQAVVDEVVRSGLAFLTTTLIRGRRALRLSICSHRTTEADIDRVFEALAETGARLDDEWRPGASLPV